MNFDISVMESVLNIADFLKKTSWEVIKESLTMDFLMQSAFSALLLGAATRTAGYFKRSNSEELTEEKQIALLEGTREIDGQPILANGFAFEPHIHLDFDVIIKEFEDSLKTDTQREIEQYNKDNPDLPDIDPNMV